MASYVTDPDLAIAEAIDRVLRAQEYQVRGERVKRPELGALLDLANRIDRINQVSDTACTVGVIDCISGGGSGGCCGCG